MRISLIPSTLFLLAIHDVHGRPSSLEGNHESDDEPSIIKQSLIESNEKEVLSEADSQKIDTGAVVSSLENAELVSAEDSPVKALYEAVESSIGDAAIGDYLSEAIYDDTAIVDNLAKTVDVSHLQDAAVEKDIQTLLQNPLIQSWLQSSNPLLTNFDHELVRIPRGNPGYGALGNVGGIGGYGGGGYGYGHPGYRMGRGMMQMPMPVPMPVGVGGLGNIGGLGGMGLGGLGVGGLGGMG